MARIFWIPYGRFAIKTYLPRETARARLAAHVEPRKLLRSQLNRKHKTFQGELNGYAFTVSRIIHYRNSAVPLLEGELRDDLDAVLIAGRMRPNWFTLIFVAIFLAAIWGSFLLSREVVWGGVFFTLAIYLSVMVGFNIEANKSESALREIFTTQQELF